MAVITDIYGKGDVVQFEGCVLNTWERNEWEKFLPTEEEKEAQRVNHAVSCMPWWARDKFGGVKSNGGFFRV